MPRPRDPHKKVQLSIRIKPTLRDMMRQAAGEDKTSVSDLVGRAVEKYLEQSDGP